MYTNSPIGGIATVAHVAILFVKGAIDLFSKATALITGFFS